MSVLRTTVAGEPVKIVFLPPTWDDAIIAFRTFTRSDPDSILGLDVETTAISEETATMFDPDARMRMIQFGTKHAAWCLDPHEPLWREEIERTLRDGGTRFVSHTSYDPLWCRAEFGINLGHRALDTKVLADLVHPGTPPGQEQHKDLKALSDTYIDEGLTEAQTAMTARFKELAPVHHRVGDKLKAWGFTNVPLDDPAFAAYAGLDAIYVRRLLDLLAARIGSRTRKLARREQLIARISNNIQWRGHLVDAEYTRARLDDIDKIYEDSDRWLADTFGCSPRSYVKRGKWFTERGVQFDKFTEVGTPQITMPSASSAGTLPLLVAQYADDDTEVGEAFRQLYVLGEHKNLRDNLRTTLGARDARGYIHPSINTQQAVTGRMSVTKPAMQTFKKGPLRGCFVARPGHVFVGADYDSQEIRLALAFSGDAMLKRIVEQGLNQHDETARGMFGADYTPKERSTAKTYNFAQQYGAGPKKLGEQLNIPYGEARAYWEQWRKVYAGLVRWTDAMSELPVVVNPYGRVIPRDRFGRGYANGNYMIQSSGRDVLGEAIERLFDIGWSKHIWLPIHDELVLEVPEDLAEQGVKVLEEAMFTTVRGVELTATASIIGTRWSGDE